MPLENEEGGMRPQPPTLPMPEGSGGTTNPGYPQAPGLGTRTNRGAPFGGAARHSPSNDKLWYAGKEDEVAD